MSKAAELANLIGNINAGGGGVNRNVIINGAMTVSQRETSFNQPADGAYTLDRFFVFRNGAGIMDVEQSTTVPSGEGFKNSLKCTVDTVDTSLGSTDFGGLATKVEGQNLVRFNFGQSTAKQFVLSFFVRSNITGTYSVAFRNGSSNRYLVKEYTISSADTWQKITITNLADNTGTWATDNTTGLDIRWCLWEGGFSASADTWGAGNIVGSSSNVNWATSTDNNFYITGVQLEVGQNPTEFEHEPYDTTLQKCQRYYYSLPDTPTSSFRICHLAHVQTATFGNSGFNHPTPMRAQPDITEKGTLVMHDGGSTRDYGIGANYSTTTTVATNIVTSSFANAPQTGTVQNNSNASNYLEIDAEL